MSYDLWVSKILQFKNAYNLFNEKLIIKVS